MEEEFVIDMEALMQDVDQKPKNQQFCSNNQVKKSYVNGKQRLECSSEGV